MATPRATDILGHVTLVTGPEEFLNQRAVTTAVTAVRAAEPESELSETTADVVSMAVLGDLAAPSLFSSIRCAHGTASGIALSPSKGTIRVTPRMLRFGRSFRGRCGLSRG